MYFYFEEMKIIFNYLRNLMDFVVIFVEISL